MNPSQAFELKRHELIQAWAKYTIERLQRSIDKKKVIDTGSLRYSLLYHLLAGPNGEISNIQLTFNYYGKFVDMGVGKGQKIESVKGNRDLISLAGHGRRPKVWFSKTFYSEVTELRDLLLQNYGEEGAQIIKETISQTILLAA
jgi:hypothetical protein